MRRLAAVAVLAALALAPAAASAPSDYPDSSIFTNPSACCSVHYLVDGQAGASYPGVTQFVHDQDVAFHAGNLWFNQHSIGIEHDGFADGPIGYYTPQMYKRSATLAGWIAAQYGIPVDRAHIVSHANLPAPFQSLTSSMHWDPGPFWGRSTSVVSSQRLQT